MAHIPRTELERDVERLFDAWREKHSDDDFEFDAGEDSVDELKLRVLERIRDYVDAREGNR